MNSEIAREEEYNVQMPNENMVYADTVLDQTILIRDVDEDEGFVSYTEESEIENVKTDTMQRFLASLASGRFVALGERTDTEKVLSSDTEVVSVFNELYGVDPRQRDPIEIARQIVGNRVSETIVFED
jgi:hypothetical protein